MSQLCIDTFKQDKVTLVGVVYEPQALQVLRCHHTIHDCITHSLLECRVCTFL
jgi:hypothetical protein